MPRAQKNEFPAEKWDKKKIIFTILIVAALIFAAFQLKSYILSDSKSSSEKKGYSQDVEGANISPTITLPTAEQIGEELNQNLTNIKEEINHINVEEIATSSPQVKKILDDIKALPDYPASQAKQVCINICNNL